MEKLFKCALELEQADQVRVDELKNKLLVELKAILYDHLNPYINEFQIEGWKYNIGFKEEESYATAIGTITVEEVPIKFVVKVNFSNIEFKFNNIREYYGNTSYWIKQSKDFNAFVSTLFLAISRKVIELKHNYINKINEDLMQNNVNYSYILYRVINYPLLSQTFKNDFNSQYSRKAQLQIAEKEEKEAIRKATALRLAELKAVYDLLYTVQRKKYAEWVNEVERAFFKPFYVYSILYCPKSLSLIKEEESEEGLDLSSLYLRCDVTEEKPSKDGFYTMAGVGNDRRIKILGEIISITQLKMTVPGSKYCALISVPGDVAGYISKNYVYVNPEKVKELMEYFNTADIPKVQSFDDFMQEKGYKRDGSREWILPA